MSDEVELTPENAGQLLFGRPARAPEAELPDPADDVAGGQQEPEDVDAVAGDAEFTDMASALRGQSQASKREAARALVASIHGTEEPDEGEPTDAGARQALAGYANKHRDLIASIHPGVARTDGTASTGFDGGARIDHDVQRPSSRIELAQQGIFVSPRDEIGWGPEIEIEDGAALLFPWLEDR